MIEVRPWGTYEVLLDETHYKVKRIVVHPKQQLSYQYHTKRQEHWTMVMGQADVVLDDVTHSLVAGEHIFIPLQSKHRIKNTGLISLIFIEVQTGTYFGEDDIVRIQDDYGRQ
jgi:mannose-6-phosphate isomerase